MKRFILIAVSIMLGCVTTWAQTEITTYQPGITSDGITYFYLTRVWEWLLLLLKRITPLVSLLSMQHVTLSLTTYHSQLMMSGR